MDSRHRCLCRRGLAALLALAWLTPPALAGMAAPLPEHPERILRLNESAEARIQAISFFLAGLLLATAAVQVLWNLLRRDFPRMPRLTFGKALAGVLLWGTLFILVLAMVAGA